MDDSELKIFYTAMEATSWKDKTIYELYILKAPFSSSNRKERLTIQQQQ